jgi:uncharacterized protein YukE
MGEEIKRSELEWRTIQSFLEEFKKLNENLEEIAVKLEHIDQGITYIGNVLQSQESS